MTVGESEGDDPVDDRRGRSVTLDPDKDNESAGFRAAGFFAAASTPGADCLASCADALPKACVKNLLILVLAFFSP